MTPDLSIASKQTVGKRIAANTGLMLGSKFLSVVLGLGSIILATKYLDVASLGVILFLHAYMLFFSEVATFKSWQSIIRFGTEHVKKNDVPELSKLLKFSIKLDALGAVFAFIAALGTFSFAMWLTQQLPDFFNRPQVMPQSELRQYLTAYCGLVLLRQQDTSIGILRLFDKFNMLAVQNVVMPVIRFAGVVIAAITGAGFEGFLLAWFAGSFAAYIFFPLVGLTELGKRRLLKPVFKTSAPFTKMPKGIWPFVIKSNIDSTLDASTKHLPALMVMGVFGSVWVAIFRVAEELAKLLSEGFKLLDQVIYPELAKMISNGKESEIWRLVTRTALILVAIGATFSFIIIFFGPSMVSALLSDDYIQAAPLTSLLVPAAVLLGIAAPLYPVLYAADKPERAIYARGAGVIIYIIAFFGFSFTIGRMAPGWAAILGNAASVVFLVYLAKRTLDQRLKEGDAAPLQDMPAPSINFIGQSDKKIWGLPIEEWQQRAFKKAGAAQETAATVVHIGVNWVLSSALARAFVSGDKTILAVDDIIIGVNNSDKITAQMLIGQPLSAADVTGFKVRRPDDLDDGYNKALRKSEPPYALDINSTPVVDIMARQFAASYKGITDFVTKWIWPLPAFYVTRACAALRLTPNMVTTVGLFFTLAAMYYFWQGQWFLGFLTGWLMTFLDTVDGKLARTTMTYSAWGNIYDHGIDLIHPPFWYVAWFVGLGATFAWPDFQSDGMTLALIALMIGYWVDRIVEGIFIAQHGFHIHVWKRINSALRFFTARRNPNMFIFMIGIIASVTWPQAGVYGFYAVTIWTWICIMFNVITVVVSWVSPKPLTSWMDS